MSTAPSTAPGTFIETNVIGTYTLLEAARAYWRAGAGPRASASTTSPPTRSSARSGAEGKFTEDTPYDPRSPYSASKAASDHLVRAWHETYGLPVVMTNCSNNYGPYHFPEKLIPVIILNALAGQADPGLRRRARTCATGSSSRITPTRSCWCWSRARSGRSYNIGGENEARNIDLVRTICRLLDERRPHGRAARPADHLRRRPPRSRPSLRHRPLAHPRGTGLAALGHARGGAGADGRLVSGQRGLVAAASRPRGCRAAARHRLSLRKGGADGPIRRVRHGEPA